MSNPPEPPEPFEPPDQPSVDAKTSSKSKRRQGAVVATLVSIGLFPLVGPGAALFCVVLGSVLTIFGRTRQFAVGFLIASAVLTVVTAGACVVLIASFSSALSLGVG